MYKTLRLLPIAAITFAFSQSLWSADARSIALGGSAIANAQGAHGALENPASMMEMKRAGQRIHFRFGLSADLRDTGDAIDTLTDDANKSLLTDIETQVEELSTRELQCDPLFGNPTDVCIDDTQQLSDLANRLLDVANTVDDESIELQLVADFGLAFTQTGYPVAISIRAMATGSGSPDIVETDKDYVGELANLLDDNTLTLDEVSNSTYLEADALGIPLGVEQPEDVLLSEGEGSTLIRRQLGIGFASTYKISGHSIDVGITPKFSSLSAYSLNVTAAEELNNTADPLADRFEDSEVTESSFTIDLGASLALSRYPVRVAAVIRNLLPESIQTMDGFEFETTPQLIVGAVFKTNLLSITGDIALNEAKQDNFRSQKIALGAELTFKSLALRGGISHNAARKDDTTAISLGFGLGPLQVGGRLTEQNAMESSVQLSYSF